MIRIACYKCSVPIHLEQDVYQHLKESGRDFWCLNGHSQSYRADNEKDKTIAALKRELAARVQDDLQRAHNKCPDCPKDFDSPGALKRHRLRVHRHLKALPENAGKSN